MPITAPSMGCPSWRRVRDAHHGPERRMPMVALDMGCPWWHSVLDAQRDPKGRVPITVPGAGCPSRPRGWDAQHNPGRRMPIAAPSTGCPSRPRARGAHHGPGCWMPIVARSPGCPSPPRARALAAMRPEMKQTKRGDDPRSRVQQQQQRRCGQRGRQRGGKRAAAMPGSPRGIIRACSPCSPPYPTSLGKGAAPRGPVGAGGSVPGVGRGLRLAAASFKFGAFFFLAAAGCQAPHVHHHRGGRPGRVRR